MAGDTSVSRRSLLHAGGFLAVGACLGVLGTLAVQRRQASRAGAGRGTQAAPEQEDLQPQFAFSLRVLQEELRGRRGSNLHTTIGGMNRIRSITLEADGEVLLLGDRDPGLPALSLDDLVVSLRNAYRAGDVYQQPPGCTIDPREGAADPWQIQQVKVLGMPATAPMAARHVAVDYELKKVSAGVLSLKPGMRSLFELERASSAFCQDAPGAPRESETVHRFWFYPRYPDPPRFVQEEGAVWIRKPVEVQLLTEQEFLDKTGRRVGAKAAEPLAERFAATVTELLASGEIPQYAALRNDFRVIEVGRLIEFLGAPAESLAYILTEHVMAAASVPSFVGGIWREERGEATCENPVTEKQTPGGKFIQSQARLQRYRRRIRGGVEARIEVPPQHFTEGGGALAQLRQTVRDTRPSADALLWPVYA